MMIGKTVLGAALGPCVHVAGLNHFLDLCDRDGWRTLSLGPAVPPAVLLAAVRDRKPDLVAVSYRLTAEDLEPLLRQIKDALDSLPEPAPRWVFGGTPPAAAKAKESGLFEKVFDGSEDPADVVRFINAQSPGKHKKSFPADLVSRIEVSYPFPLIRHHYGEPDLAATLRGARRIARSQVLDVLSIGPDQNAQEHFFRPGEMDPRQDGAGGVPLRSPQDLGAIYKAVQCGNHPLVRCYSGTRDLRQWAEMSLAMLHNAWAAIPLCWYNCMDGRSKIGLLEAIEEKVSAIHYCAQRGNPVEVNESHQWSLRDAHDSLAVAMAFLAAYNAKAQGVNHYVIQMMFNTPPSTSPAMDIAKMQAKLDLIQELEGPGFHTYREVRSGITSLPFDLNEAKGHMAASVTYAMTMKPHILHVVGFTEASHVVTPAALIESCKIARAAARLALKNSPQPLFDPDIEARRQLLVAEARDLLEGIRRLGAGAADPWQDPGVLAKAIQMGVLDTPHFRESPHACGRIVTACVDGGWDAIDPNTRRPMRERERLERLGITL